MTYLLDSRWLVDRASADVDAIQSNQGFLLVERAFLDQSESVVVRARVCQKDGLASWLDFQETGLEMSKLLLTFLVLEPRTEP